MKRMANHPSLARAARALTLASILGLAACGDNAGHPTDGGADKPHDGQAGSSAGASGGGGSSGATGHGGVSGAAGTTGAAGAAGTTGAAGAAGTTGAAGTGGVAGTTGAAGTGGAAGASDAGGAGGTGGAAGAGAAGGGGTDAGNDGPADGGTDSPIGAANGAVCATATDCASGFCADAVCCETACAGSCAACSSAKTGQANGLCRPVTGGTDPDNECAQAAVSGCGLDGQCDGVGACRKWVVGTVCVSESCSGSNWTPARTCDGAGTCRTSTGTSCGAYECNATSCKTSCASSADCSTGNYCAGTACVPVKGQGAVCAAAGDCASGNCVDGVCCESACASSCAACSNAKTGQADGLCRPVSGGTDPDDECAQDLPSSCGLDGQCDGAGACRKWPAGSTCVGESCTGSTHTPTRTCDGTGTCRTANSASCGAYVCGATTCKTSCASNSDCTTGGFCSGGVCISPQVNGSVCGAGGECASGFCVDGVCCESVCAGSCAACSNAKTSLADGLCRPVTGGTDPDGDCTQDAASTCGRDGQCDGAGACRKWAASTICVAESCIASSYTPAGTCDGAGTCLTGTATSCGAYVCGATSCATSCGSNSDCTTGNFCSAGVCVPQETNGTACVAAGDCGSGFCVDGVCCNSACGGTCQTCAAVGTVGQCTPAAPGTNPRSDCTATAASTCGNDGFCDGAGACRNYAAGTVCQAAGCSNASVSAASTCDGAGVCNAGTTSSCGPYQCSGAVCGTSCATDGACTGFCSAAACFAPPVNLAGNGDMEYGTTNGWTTNGGVTLVVENGMTTAGLSHAGTYAVADTARTANFQGPGYALPTGAGVYNISLWAMQNDNPTQTAAVQVALSCGSTATSHFPIIGTYGFSLPQGVWTRVSGTVDLSATADCQPGAATPGVVRSALLYLNQAAAGSTVAFPNLFLDDVVVQVTDGHNLVGNPNFEAAVTNGWQNNGGGTLAANTTVFKSGTHSLALTGRTSAFNGPRWTMPIGAAKYNVTFNGLHNGALPHDLILQSTYTCLGGSAQFPASIAVASQVGGNGWNTLSGTVTIPPANAPAGCKVTAAGIYMQQENGTCGAGAGQIECPDLFVDDVSITLAP